MAHCNLPARDITIGLDLGDKESVFYILDERKEQPQLGRVKTTPEDFKRFFSQLEPARVVMECGTHSPWASRVIAACGHQVLVANPRQIPAIYANHKKTDRTDAEILARLGRFDPELLKPIEHRSEEAQLDLAIIRTRDAVVEVRTKLINSIRAIVKSSGHRLPSSSAESFHKRAIETIPASLQERILPTIQMIEQLTDCIRQYDKQIDALCEKKYVETRRLRQVPGVGPLTALAFILILEDSRRFTNSRKVGAFLGLTPRLDDSSGRKSQLRISKAGNTLLRRLLVSSSQYIRCRSKTDSDLRRHGEAIAQRGGSRGKKCATVAIARKLSVLLHRLWVSGECYEPLRNSEPRGSKKPRMKTSVA